jgi:hypothetical protein
MEDRDLAHEADMRALMRQQLRDDISAQEAEEELRDIWDQEQPEYYNDLELECWYQDQIDAEEEEKLEQSLALAKLY